MTRSPKPVDERPNAASDIVKALEDHARAEGFRQGVQMAAAYIAAHPVAEQEWLCVQIRHLRLEDIKP